MKRDYWQKKRLEINKELNKERRKFDDGLKNKYVLLLQQRAIIYDLEKTL